MHAHTCRYAAPLSEIKASYEACIAALQAQLGRSAREHAAQQAEFLATHEAMVSSLRTQLDDATTRLAAA